MKLGVSLQTLEEFINIPEVRKVWEEGEADAHQSLRRAQFQLAKKQSAMAIHLGKTYLGQKEEVHVSGHVTLENLITEARRIKDNLDPDDIVAEIE